MVDTHCHFDVLGALVSRAMKDSSECAASVDSASKCCNRATAHESHSTVSGYSSVA